MNYNALAAIEEQAEMLREYGNHYAGYPSSIMHDYPKQLAGSVAYVCLHAETMYLDPRIQVMLEQGMETLPDTVPLLHTDIPFRMGFVKLGKSVRFNSGLTIGESFSRTDLFKQSEDYDEITHIAWKADGVDKDSKLIKESAPSPTNISFQQRMGESGAAIIHTFGHTVRHGKRSPFQHLNSFPWGYGLALDDDEYYRDFETEWAGRHIDRKTHIDAGTVFTDSINSSTLAMDVYMKQINAFRWSFAIWHFMAQKVAAKERQHPDRAMQRRAQRNPDEWQDNKWVDIITLRASASAAHREFNETSRHVSVRFIVRGHWRNQWYPSEGRNKPIWIMPYVKGPDGAPVQSPTKLFNIAR